MGFTHILNVTTEIENCFEDDPSKWTNLIRKGIEYCKIPVGDFVDSQIGVYFRDCYEFLSKNIEKRIFVHCVLGRSRSCSIVVMYLMKSLDLDFDQVRMIILIFLKKAYELVLEMRTNAQINLGFEQQLIKFSKNGFNF